MLQHVYLLLGSFVANTLSAIAGGGAGLLQLPLLLMLGLPFQVALATHKVASVFLGVGAGLRSHKSYAFSPKYSLLLLTGLPGVWLGTLLIVKLSNTTATLLLGFITLGLGLYSIRKPNLGLHSNLRPLSPAQWAFGSVVLMLIGVLNGSLTSGTGLFVTLWLVRYFGFDIKTASAYTLFFVGLLWNGLGAASLANLSYVQLNWLPMLILGSVLGGYIGVWIASKQPPILIKRAFEVLTILVGIHLIVRAIG